MVRYLTLHSMLAWMRDVDWQSMVRLGHWVGVSGGWDGGTCFKHGSGSVAGNLRVCKVLKCCVRFLSVGLM